MILPGWFGYPRTLRRVGLAAVMSQLHCSEFKPGGIGNRSLSGDHNDPR